MLEILLEGSVRLLTLGRQKRKTEGRETHFERLSMESQHMKIKKRENYWKENELQNQKKYPLHGLISGLASQRTQCRAQCRSFQPAVPWERYKPI
jgi:hypothetical protein